ncbi:MAG: uncharacterized protein A8A55_3184, partial [Amphiamblys sp. WSBS2006]
SYGLKKVKKIGQHVVSEYREGRGVTITTNITAKTMQYVKHDKPDIVVVDHRKKLVHIVEVGITSRERIKTVETEKKHKYADLAVQLGRQHAGYATLVTPYVMTWDGSTTAFSKKYREQIGLSDHVHAHIQANVIGDTRKIVTRTMGLDKEGELRRKQIVYNTEPDRLNSVNQARSNYP